LPAKVRLSFEIHKRNGKKLDGLERKCRGSEGKKLE
jgi:hypothetical protein